MNLKYFGFELCCGTEIKSNDIVNDLMSKDHATTEYGGGRQEWLVAKRKSTLCLHMKKSGAFKPRIGWDIENNKREARKRPSASWQDMSFFGVVLNPDTRRGLMTVTGAYSLSQIEKIFNRVTKSTRAKLHKSLLKSARKSLKAGEKLSEDAILRIQKSLEITANPLLRREDISKLLLTWKSVNSVEYSTSTINQEVAGPLGDKAKKVTYRIDIEPFVIEDRVDNAVAAFTNTIRKATTFVKTKLGDTLSRQILVGKSQENKRISIPLDRLIQPFGYYDLSDQDGVKLVAEEKVAKTLDSDIIKDMLEKLDSHPEYFEAVS